MTAFVSAIRAIKVYSFFDLEPFGDIHVCVPICKLCLDIGVCEQAAMDIFRAKRTGLTIKFSLIISLVK